MRTVGRLFFHAMASLVHQVRDWFSGAAAYFGWMSDKAASQKTRSPEGCDENGPAAALLLSHVSIQIYSFVAPCRRPILIATPLNQSRTWCTRSALPVGTPFLAGWIRCRLCFLDVRHFHLTKVRI